MAQLFPDDIVNLPDLSQLSHALCKIFEKNLSDEWECHAILDGSEISHFIVVSPDIGVLTLLISKCQPEQFDSFFQSIPELQQNCLDAFRNELQKNEHLCDKNGALSFPLGFGMLFPGLSSDELNISVGALSQFSIFADKLKEVSNSDDELEELLFDMVEGVDFDGLSQENLEIITHVILTFREKYPLPYKKETHSPSPDALSNRGDNEMQVSRGIEPFLNHLEFLGYECQKNDTENEDIVAYLCCHSNEVDIILAHSSSICAIFFKVRLNLQGVRHENFKKSILEAINNFNSTSIFVYSYLDEDGGVICSSMLPEMYSKIEFGRFFRIFSSKVEECYQILSEVQNDFLNDNYQDDNPHNSGDVPF